MNWIKKNGDLPNVFGKSYLYRYDFDGSIFYKASIEYNQDKYITHYLEIIDVKDDVLDAIIDIVCDYYNTTLDVIKHKTRVGKIPNARHLIMAFGSMYYNRPLYDISERIGINNHTMCNYSIKKCANLYETNPAFRFDYNTIHDKIKAYLGDKINVQTEIKTRCSKL